VSDEVEPVVEQTPAAPELTGPWANDLKEYFGEDPELLTKANAFMAEKYQPYVTRLEQESAPARALYKDLTEDFDGTMQALLTEVYEDRPDIADRYQELINAGVDAETAAETAIEESPQAAALPPEVHMADTATFSAAMKTKFIGPIRDNLHKGKVLLFGDAEANPETSRASSRAPRASTSSATTSASRSRRRATRPSASVRERDPPERRQLDVHVPDRADALRLRRLQHHRPAHQGVETNEGAFKQAFKAEMEDTILSSKLDHNRAAFGNGVGVMGTIRTNAAGAATVIDGRHHGQLPRRRGTSTASPSPRCRHRAGASSRRSTESTAPSRSRRPSPRA
jgi:hypothetical protein